MKKPIGRLERLILKELLTSEKGVPIYTFHRKYAISPDDLFHAIKHLEAEGLLKEQEQDLVATEKAKEFSLQVAVPNEPSDREPWRKIPESMLRQKLEVNAFYIPSIEHLDPDTFFPSSE